jgi:D-alanyl-D-alanine carboxypeptidase
MVDTSKTQKFEKIFDKFTTSNQIHEGILFIESRDGDFSYSKGYGGKELDSPLFMASITKLLTTTCILALQEQDRLSLDDKLTKYFDDAMLSGLHIYSGNEYSFDLTISDLLFQISGLPDVFEEGNDSIKHRFIREDFSISFEELITKTKKLKPHFAPSTKRKAYYADINFDILGEIIEKVTHSTLAEAYRDFIFEPLALKNTYLLECDNDFVPTIFYRNNVLYRPKMIMSSRASGGCITTARELMEFIKAFFCGTLFNTTIFDELSLCNKLQHSMWPIRYGSGYMKIPLHGLITLFMGKGELIGHSGSTGSFAFYYPVKEVFFVGDLNQMANAALPLKLSMRLAMMMRD